MNTKLFNGESKSSSISKNCSVQFITHYNDKYSFIDSARIALDGGCRWIQLCMKGERSLDVVTGENEVVNGTKEIYPGLYAASAVSGTPRMGPIFGGMFLSGKKVADLIIQALKK